MTGETAKLIVELLYKSNLSSAVGKDEAALSGLNRTTAGSRGHLTGLVGAAGAAEKGIVRFGGAMGHAKNQLTGLLTGPLGIIGLSSGLFSLGGILEGSLRHTSDFSLGLEKLMGVTGETAQASGTLLLEFEKFGLSADRTAQIAGFAEKTLGKMSETMGKAGKSTALLALEQQKLQLQASGATKAIKGTADATLKGLEAQKKTVADQRAFPIQGHLTAASRKAYAEQIAAINAEIKAHHGLRTARQSSALAAIDHAIALQKYRDSLAGTGAGVSKLAAFEKQHGISLHDSAGNLVTFSEELNRVADYYNSNRSAAEKATVAATLFGRGYAAMIPILKLGSKGIADAAQSAKDLGLSLTPDNVVQLAHYREAIRTLGEAAGILQLQIGLGLAPEITKLAQTITAWMAGGGSKQIVSFFKDAANFAGQFGDAMSHTVVPAFGALARAWDSVPGPLKDLLIGGFVANKAGKFLFDKSLFGGAKGLLERILGKVPVISSAVSAADPGQRVFVTNFADLITLQGGGNIIQDFLGGGKGGKRTSILDLLKFVIPWVAAAAVVSEVRQPIVDLGNQGSKAITGRDNPLFQSPDQWKQPTFSPDNNGLLGTGLFKILFEHAHPPLISGGMSPEDRSIEKAAAQAHADALAGSAKEIAALAALPGAIEAKRQEHMRALQAVGGTASGTHEFLQAFRTGGAKIAIQDFDKELHYIRTASDAQIKTATTQSLIRQNIDALKHDMVGATNAQKQQLSRDIAALIPYLINIAANVGRSLPPGHDGNPGGTKPGPHPRSPRRVLLPGDSPSEGRIPGAAVNVNVTAGIPYRDNQRGGAIHDRYTRVYTGNVS